MIPNYANINEIIEAADRLQVKVARYPGQTGWTTHRTVFAGSIVSYDVQFWPSGERAVVSAVDADIVSKIAMPHPPQPFWADPAAEMPELLPGNVIPFPQHRVAPSCVAGGRS